MRDVFAGHAARVAAAAAAKAAAEKAAAEKAAAAKPYTPLLTPSYSLIPLHPPPSSPFHIVLTPFRPYPNTFLPLSPIHLAPTPSPLLCVALVYYSHSLSLPSPPLLLICMTPSPSVGSSGEGSSGEGSSR
eukprot:CAMPEP_0173339876 /NCGR_PEP_ID=MMETSP1144-20121109/8637_1 /TAXON_ID=483371 /ORGANISM="non described non described, Strain CCMP2298" /LENGTH=130 /DNA_ID=CAMNT_0014285891 /DNA_START=40 /DNA_END=429 /DNA_ORIENTATION=+